MATSATLGTGCIFSVDPAGGSSYGAVAEVDSFSIDMECAEIEATNLDSGGRQQWLPGSLAATVQVSGNFIPGTQGGTNTLHTNWQNGTTTSWKLQFNEATATIANISGKGFFTDLSIDINGPDEVNTFSCTLRDNGTALPTLSNFA